MPESVGMTADRVADLTCRAAGRRTVVRNARYVLSRARLDYPNDLPTHGESALQRWILRFSRAETRFTLRRWVPTSAATELPAATWRKLG
jgi:hypothetical protein